MTSNTECRKAPAWLANFALVLLVLQGPAGAKPQTRPAGDASIYSPRNLLAWCVVPFDAKKRGPEERAEMLKRLGFTRFAYDWRDKDIPTFDAEADALKKNGIELVAWWFPTNPDDKNARTILEVAKRHDIHPQLWVMGGGPPTKTPREQTERVDREADRIARIVKLAEPYGCKVELYNHGGWFGQTDNEVAIIERLKEKGVSGVGMVYNFSHGHADMADFPAIWKRMQPYVVTVNVAGMVPVNGMAPDGRLMPPSQGEGELKMMRVIAQSGWHGPVGVIAEQGGDAAVTLGNDLRGMAWLKMELEQPGSGGERPQLGPRARPEIRKGGTTAPGRGDRG